jgi:translation initiation factor IF-2
MADVSVSVLAKSVGISEDQLLLKLKEAGLPQRSANDLVTDQQKQALLNFMQAEKGPAKKITLNRKPASDSRVTSPLTRGKSINVEVRKKRTFVIPSPEEIAQLQREEEEAKAAQLEAERLEQEAAKAREAAKLAEQNQPKAAKAEEPESSPAEPVAEKPAPKEEASPAKKVEAKPVRKAFPEGSGTSEEDRRAKKGKPKFDTMPKKMVINTLSVADEEDGHFRHRRRKRHHDKNLKCPQSLKFVKWLSRKPLRSATWLKKWQSKPAK